MLGKYHSPLPEGKHPIEFRADLLRLARKVENRRAFMHMCRQDILFWINGWVWQYNPNAIGVGSAEIGPFMTWGFQEEAIGKVQWCIQKRRDLLIQKSREMGASWLCLLIMLWRFLFLPRQKFLLISRNEDAVYNPGDSDSLFWKLQFVLEKLPGWMKDGRINERRLVWNNDLLVSSITGQATTSKAGVGGRATAMFLDEFSQIDQAFEVLHRTSDTTGCRIFNGTHTGVGNCFYELSQSPVARIEKLYMHWTQHPDKRKGMYRYNRETNKIEVLDKEFVYPEDFSFQMVEAPLGGPYPGVRSPWYDEQTIRKGNQRAVSMDLDIDAGGSQSQFFNPLTIRRLKEEFCREPMWRGEISCDRATGDPLGLVELPEGIIHAWVLPNRDGKFARGKYCGGADLSRGSGATNSVFTLANAKTGEKVLEMVTPHQQPEDFAVMCVALCKMFVDDYGTPALLSWEHAGPGQLFGKTVMDLGYSRIYKRKSHEASNRLNGTSEIVGWYPMVKEKQILLDEYRAALDCRKFINPCALAMDECLQYRYNPKTGYAEHPKDVESDDPTGARINHGDRVIADALCWKMVKELDCLVTAETPAPKAFLHPGSLAGRYKMWEDERSREAEWV